MLPDKHSSLSFCQIKPQHAFDYIEVNKIYFDAVGPAEWYNKHLELGSEGFKIFIRAYHQEVILSCPQSTDSYLSSIVNGLNNYGTFLSN